MDPNPVASEALVARARRPAVVGAAAALAGIDGLLIALYGIQNAVLVQWHPPWDNAVYALVALGAAVATMGVLVARVDSRAHRAAAVLAGIAAVATAGWFVFSTTSGAFSLLGLVAASGAAVTLVVLVLSLRPCRETEEARAALRREGIEFNL